MIFASLFLSSFARWSTWRLYKVALSWSFVIPCLVNLHSWIMLSWFVIAYCDFVSYWWCSSWISVILALKPRGTRSFKMCSLSTLPLPFQRFTMTLLPHRLRGSYRCSMMAWFGLLSREYFTFLWVIPQCSNIIYTPKLSKMGLFKPMLFFIVYKHNNIFGIKLLIFAAAAARGIQWRMMRRHAFYF